MKTDAAASAGIRNRAWLAAVGLMVLCYAALQVALWLTLETAVSPNALLRDVVAHCLVAVLLFATARSFRHFVAAMLALLIAFHLSNGLKLAILGAPIMPDDFGFLGNMFLLLEGWQLLGAAALLAIPVSLLAAMVDWRARRTWGISAFLATAIAVLILFPNGVVRAMDSRFGDWVWNQRGNYESRGLVIHLIQEFARNLSRKTRAPNVDEVAESLSVLGNPGAAGPLRVTRNTQPRNVHVIVLESFWDPTPLGASRFSADPLDPRFRELWKAAGYSHALSPVFGGYTANAEFEVLCGFPVTQDSVFFEGQLRRDAPCLPHQLDSAGYESFASHPNSAAFWNRVNAYRRIGFGTYWSDRDFILDDMNGNFLSDGSLFRQVLDRIDPALAGSTPVFNYVLTYSGHLPYPLNEKRPVVIHATGDNSVLEAYANTLYYKSRELMEFLDALQAKDPDGLIVLFGDHLPFLGPNHAVYTDTGLLADKRGKFSDQMFRTLVATPLVVIDGRRGPLDVGDLPMYRLPAVILSLLGDERPSVMRLTASPSRLAIVRPLPGMFFLATGESVVACREETAITDADCAAGRHWLKAVETVTRDVFSGEQHSLHQLPRSVPLRQEAATGDDAPSDPLPG